MDEAGEHGEIDSKFSPGAVDKEVNGGESRDGGSEADEGVEDNFGSEDEEGHDEVEDDYGCL